MRQFRQFVFEVDASSDAVVERIQPRPRHNLEWSYRAADQRVIEEFYAPLALDIFLRPPLPKAPDIQRRCEGCNCEECCCHTLFGAAISVIVGVGIAVGVWVFLVS